MEKTEKIQDTFIHRDQVRCILAYKSQIDHTAIMVQPEQLDWVEYDEEYAELSLKSIGNQLKRLGYESPYYVWEESGLHGEIYQYGNYDPLTWEKHGTTKGYA